jgi:hypothetical protein
MQQLAFHRVISHCIATNPQVTQTVALYNLLYDLTRFAARDRQVLRDLLMLHNPLMQQLVLHRVIIFCIATNPQVTQTVALYNLLGRKCGDKLHGPSKESFESNCSQIEQIVKGNTNMISHTMDSTGRQ